MSKLCFLRLGFCAQFSFWFCLLFLFATESVLSSADISNCPLLTNPLNGHVVIHPNGIEAQFVCNPRHTLVGSATLVCHNGAWSNSAPVCRFAGISSQQQKPLTSQYTLLRSLSDLQYQQEYNLPAAHGWRSSQHLLNSKRPLFSWDSVPLLPSDNRVSSTESHDSGNRKWPRNVPKSSTTDISGQLNIVKSSPDYTTTTTTSISQRKRKNNSNTSSQQKRLGKITQNNRSNFYDGKKLQSISNSNKLESEERKLSPEESLATLSQKTLYVATSLNSKSVTLNPSDVSLRNNLESVIEDSSKISKMSTSNNNLLNIESNYIMMNYTDIDLRKLDMSCFIESNDNVTNFLSAPKIVNGVIDTYRRRHNPKEPFNAYLEVFYSCVEGHRLRDSLSHSLYCLNDRWVGVLPECLPETLFRDKKIGIDDEDPEIGNKSSCSNNKGGCQHVCEESDDGNTFCFCYKGFTLMKDKKSCEDINECNLGNDTCQYQCWNVPGSYICYCPEGYNLASDKKSCLDKNECLLRNGHGPCQDTCINHEGGYRCSCNIPGTQLSLDNHTCEDIDECANDNAGCSHTCLNTIGAAFCSCPEGFMLGKDWKTCEDIDECQFPEMAQNCSGECINTVGSYKCIKEPVSVSLTIDIDKACDRGYTKDDNGECIDIDECSLDNFGCSHVCVNERGTASCTCPTGFLLLEDWKTCEDVDECTNNDFHCEHNCINTLGSASCSCNIGYRLNDDGKTCEDINECEVGNLSCLHKCVNTNGSAHCECHSGHQLDSDGVHCKDINECDVGNGGCQHECVNIAGSYHCLCNRFYTLKDDEHSCILEEQMEVPFLTCPPPISVELQPGRDKVSVKIPRPDGNVDFSTVYITPPWIHNLEGEFPAGMTTVTFESSSAVSGSYTATCSVQVTVLDKEAPVVVSCPSPIFVSTDPDKQYIPVTWNEPQFRDNVGVVYTWKSKEPGMFLPGIHHVKYIARDAAGNAAYCTFTVQITSDKNTFVEAEEDDDE